MISSQPDHTPETATLEGVSRRVPEPHILAMLESEKGVRHGIAHELFVAAADERDPFGVLFPGLDAVGGPPLWSRGVGVRASNLLRRKGYVSWRELASVQPPALLALPNLGAGTFVEIVSEMMLAWAETLLADGTPAYPRPDGHESLPPGWGDLARSVSATADLETMFVTAWMCGAQSVAEAFELWRAGGLGSDAANPALIRLHETPLTDVADVTEFDASDWEWLTESDDRSRFVLENRVYPEGPPLTLDAIGRHLDVTRERIRQVETQVRKKLEGRLAEPRARGLHHLAARLRAVGPLVEGDRLERAAEALLSKQGDGSSLHRRMLIALAGPWRDFAGYRTPAYVARVLDSAAASFRDLGPGARPSEGELAHLLSVVGQEAWAPHVLDGLGLSEICGVIVVSGRTHAERAVAVLGAHNRPLSFDELHDAIGHGVSPRSLQNALLADDRIMRRGKGTYGLQSWGGEEYTGIAEELEQAMERSGGSVVLEETVERFAHEFGVSPASVRSYANDSRFLRHSDGTLTMRGAGDPDVTVVHRPIDQTAGAFRLDGVWHFRYEIDAEGMRGSGRPLRVGIAQAAGLEPGLIIGVTFHGGTVTFSWRGSQPSIGSVRSVAAHHGCGVGDVLLIPLSGREPRDARVVRGAERLRWSGLKRLAAEIGVDPDDIDEEEQPLEIADALGLPPGADWYEIADRLRDRGDRALLEHLPEPLT